MAFGTTTHHLFPFFLLCLRASIAKLAAGSAGDKSSLDKFFARTSVHTLIIHNY